jgi:hypothetical protein
MHAHEQNAIPQVQTNNSEDGITKEPENTKCMLTRRSRGLTPIACVRTKTSDAPNSGRATSSRTSKTYVQQSVVVR